MQDETFNPIYEREAELASDYAEHEIAVAKSRIGVIHYGFGAEYLPKWGIKEALREIYQNFIDYGDYEEEAVHRGNTVEVKLTSGWAPDSLEYLRIGNSKKESNHNTIGHHGEGLKMAFLILLREGFNAMIFTNKYAVYPEWYHDSEIGSCFCFQYEIHDFTEAPYTLEFNCPSLWFTEFHESLIKPTDIIYAHPEWGDMVDKKAGDIFSGGLFVANLGGMSRAYNIQPRHLPLDRDRCVPRAFDVEYAASMILDASKKMTVKDLSYSDTRYSYRLPEDMIKKVKPRRVGNDIQFTIKDDEGKDQIIQNTSIRDHLKTHSLFQKAIAGIKRFLAKQLGLYDMLIEFKQKHVHSSEALQDFELILEKVNK